MNKLGVIRGLWTLERVGMYKKGSNEVIHGYLIRGTRVTRNPSLNISHFSIA
jgi:hypothetical protein